MINRATHAWLPSTSDEMQSYILRYYDQVTPPIASFADADGAVFDCIPVQQQIALRSQTALVIAPPDPPDGVQAPNTSPPQPSGNTASAPPSTVPMHRVTLEELTRFPTRDHFLNKMPISRGKP